MNIAAAVILALGCAMAAPCADAMIALPTNATVVAAVTPRAMTLAELGVDKATLRGGAVFPESDEIRVFASTEKMSERPLARIWLNAKEGNRFWFHTGGSGSAESFKIPAGSAVLLIRNPGVSRQR